MANKREVGNKARGGFEHIYAQLERLDMVLESVAPDKKPLGTKSAIQARANNARRLVARMQRDILLIHPTANNGLLAAVSHD